MLARATVFVYGVICYLVFFATFLYAIGFVGDLFVPKSIDSGPQGPLAAALLVDLSLLGLFAVQHSLMARQWFKRALTRVVPEPAERATYVLMSSLALLLLFWQWRPLGGVVWSVEGAAGRAAIYGLYFFGWLLLLFSTCLIDHFDLFGLRQVWRHLRGLPQSQLDFRTPGLYRRVRHPIYLAWLCIFWSTPRMTAAHLVFALATTAYIFVAIRFEERDLIRLYGDEYRLYRERVPMIFPWRRGRGDQRLRAKTVAIALVCATWGLTYWLGSAPVGAVSPDPQESINNNRPAPNPGGAAATFSTQGRVDLTGEYFQAQGTNDRSCATCHIPEEAWGINPGTLQRLFSETDGRHAVFNKLDANNPDVLPEDSTAEQRLAAYSMLLTRGVFRRGGAPRPNSQWELIAVEDPHGYANLNRLVHWRRVMPTINFPLGSTTVNWDGGNSIGDSQHDNLINQAGRNVTGAQQGPAAPREVLDDIVAFEESLFTAQLLVPGVGRLDADGARGGPEALSTMPKVAGRFDLFDAWAGHSNPRRAQIARGQELFNNPNPGGSSCSACHNAANNGTNINNRLFDIGTASVEARTPDLPLYTFRNRLTGQTRQLTDAGRGQVTGLWNDLGRFKTPTLRALPARAPYFHNGTALTLEDVVRHYERHLGFVFSDAERADLVAFLGAL